MSGEPGTGEPPGTLLTASLTRCLYSQNATEKIASLNTNLSTSFGTAKDMSKDLVGNAHITAQAYSQSIVSEVEKIQSITLALPKQLQLKLQPVQQSIAETVSEITSIVKNGDVPVNEKAVQVKNKVQEKVHPLLVQTTQTIQAYIAEAKNYISGTKGKVEEEVKETTNDHEESAPAPAPAPVHDHNEDVPSFVAPVPEPTPYRDAVVTGTDQ